MGSLKADPELENGSTSMLNLNPLDPDEFRRQAHMMVDFLADYYQNIEKYPVRSQVEPGYLSKCVPGSAPYDPEPIEKILYDVERHIIPGITHWQSPNHFAFFPCGGSIAGFLGEMLSTGFNVVGFNWMSSPAATELESIVMDWLGKMLQLPNSFLFSGGGGGGGGVLQGTTCEAILCTLAAARDHCLDRIGRDWIGKLVVYGSDQTHFAVQKAARIAGINPDNFRDITTTKASAFGLSPDSLESAIVSDVKAGLIPLFLCATVGTTSSTAVDSLGPLCDVAKRYNMWVHVDAAYAGSACICPEFRHFIDGVEALSTSTPEYLKNKATESNQVVDYKDWQIALSRRFRAMKLWLVLRTYGLVNLRNFIRGHVNMAKHFEGLVAMDHRFELVVPRNFAMVCFRVSPSALHDHREPSDENCVNKFNCKLLESINSAGRIYMTHAVVGGVYVIRFAVGASLTNYQHVNMAWKVVQDHAHAMLLTSS
ncbi:hypothetical protein ACSBR2_022656 [Camellia fascicularis]